MTRTEITHLAGGHWTAEEVAAALQKIALDGLAISEKSKTKGRPVERWTSLQHANKAKEAKEVHAGTPGTGLNSLTSLNSSFSERDRESVGALRAKEANKADEGLARALDREVA